MIFYDEGDRRARVSIATHELGEISTRPETLEEGRQQATEVLRAMLEEFEQVHEVKCGELTNVDEHSVDMRLVKRRHTPTQR